MLPNVDKIVLLKNGTLDAVGSYEELLKQNSNFHELITNYTSSGVEDENDGDEAEVVIEEEDQIM